MSDGETRYEWDEAKNRRNISKHGLAFSEAEGFGWDEAVEEIDPSDDDEVRWRAAAPLADGKIAILIYTQRENRIRIISLRYAKRKEIRDYVEAKHEQGI